MTKLSFKPKQVGKRIISPLRDRAYDVIVSRFGLEDGKQKTLDAIGKSYGITRERVRQIEGAALASIRKGDAWKAEKASIDELKSAVAEMGALVHEDTLLDELGKDEVGKNHIYFFLVLGDDFIRHKEDDTMHPRWSVDANVADTVHTALQNIYENLSDDELVPEGDMISRLLDELKTLNEEYRKEEIVKRYLALSKSIGQNPLGEYGRAESPSVTCRGVRDYAYLVLRKHGSPLHFADVAKSIEKTFGRSTHVATCHNELIKDDRFVLVGRGQYGLSEWGYKPGTAKEVIADILKKEGPMDKDEVVDRVMKERFLKKNTILVNLQNSKHFKKNKQGMYMVA